MKDPQGAQETPALSGGRLLLSILSYRRNGRPPPPRRDPTPQEWGAWAAIQYARAIKLRSPPPEILGGPVKYDAKRKVATRPREALWRRLADYRRKLLAFHLFTLANERVRVLPDGLPDPADPWHPQAQRWADSYLGLPGGDILNTPKSSALLADLRDLQEVLKIRLAGSTDGPPWQK